MPHGAAKVFGEALRSFELRGALRRPEITNPGCTEGISETGDERRFGADNDELDALIAAELNDAVLVGRIDGDTLRHVRDLRHCRERRKVLSEVDSR